MECLEGYVQEAFGYELRVPLALRANAYTERCCLISEANTRAYEQTSPSPE